MAPMKYWLLKTKGDLSPDQVQEMLGQGDANILRIHKEAGETHVYFASSTDKPLRTKGGDAQQISMDQVTKIA